MKYKSLITNSSLLAILGISVAIYAGGPELYVAPATPSIPFFLTFGSGYSFSNRAQINADPLFWDASPQGYNGSLSNSVFYTGGFGFRFSSLISADIEATYRPSFSYSKFQTTTANGTVDFSGNKTRYFDFSNTSVMANLILHGQGLSDHLLWQFSPAINLQPIVGAGIGVAYNHMSDFHSILANGVTPVSIQNPQTTTAFAWQAMAGLELAMGTHTSVDAGYRYFNGGRFSSNNYFYAPLDGTPGVAATPWRARFSSNEVFVNLNYTFV